MGCQFVRTFVAVFLIALVRSAEAQPAPDPHAEICNSLQQRVQQACCMAPQSSYSAFGGIFREHGTATGSVDVNNCDGTTTHVMCIHKTVADAGHGMSLLSRTPKTRATGAQMAAAGQCKDTWTSVLQSPDAQFCPNLKATLSCTQKSEVSALPVCEDLAAYNASNHCSVWNLGDCLRSKHSAVGQPGWEQAERECLADRAAQVGKSDQATLKPAFNLSGTTLSLIPFRDYPPPPPGIDTADPSTPDSLSLAASQRIVPGFRIEVPGNFMRFHLRNLVLPNAMQWMAQEKLPGTQLDGKPVDGSCDVATLSCQFNPAHLFPLDDFINKAKTYTPPVSPSFSQPQGLVGIRVRRTQTGWRLSNPEFWAGPFQINWWGDANIDEVRPLRFQLSGPDTHFYVLPVHDPRDQNAPALATSLSVLDTKARFLDRAWVLFNLDRQMCWNIQHQHLDGGQVRAGTSEKDALGTAAHGFTYVQPYMCSCGNAYSTVGNYCVIDPHPREISVPGISADFTNRQQFLNSVDGLQPGSATLKEVFCDDVERVNRDPKSDIGPGASYYRTKDNVWNSFGMSGALLTKLRSDVHQFGCANINLPLLDAGDHRKIRARGDIGPPNIEIAREIHSGTGVEFQTKVDLGKVRVSLSPAPITIDFPTEFKVHKWVEERYPVFAFFPFVAIIAWIIDIVLTLIGALLTVLVSIQLYWIGAAFSGLIAPTLDVDGGQMNVTVQGTVSVVNDANTTFQGIGANVPQSHLQFNVRRVITSAPKFTVTQPWAVNLKAPACNALAGGEGSTGFEEVLNFLKNTVVCPLEVVSNMYTVLTLPVKKFLLWFLNDLGWDILGVAEEAITATATDGAALPLSNQVDLMASTVQQTLDFPRLMVTDANLKAQLAPMQPYFDEVCLLTSEPVMECQIAQMFGYYVEGPTIVRLGAKTHYRSMQEFGVNSVTEILDDIPTAHAWGEPFYPPVRYCYGGAVPVAGRADYTDQPGGLLAGLSTLEEMHYTPAGSPTPTDWRTQCAAFADMRLKLHFRATPPGEIGRILGLPPMEFIVAPSVRSNFLLNEVFFCPTEASCDLRPDITPIMDCLGTSQCNLGNAMMAYLNNPAFSLISPPIKLRAEKAVCSLLGDIWYRADATASFTNLLAAGPGGESALVAAIGATCPKNKSCAAQIARIHQVYGPWTKACNVLLKGSGLFDPVRTLKESEIPDELK